MPKAYGRLAFAGVLLSMPFLTGGNALANDFNITVSDYYWGGLNNYSALPGAPPPNKDVIEASSDQSFDIYGINANRTGNTLTVTIYTNYANTVPSGINGADSTKIGDLFLANGPVTYNNGGTGGGYAAVPGVPGPGNNFSTDTAAAAYAAGVARFQYAADASGTGLYSLNQVTPGSDIQLSYWGYTPGTNFRGGQAVGLLSGDSTIANVGETVQVVHGTNGSSDGTNTTYGGGEIIFTLTDLYQYVSLGDSNGAFTLAWAMTCANDTIYATIVPLIGSGGSTPLPAALPLLASGVGFFGFLNWRRKRKVATCMLPV